MSSLSDRDEKSDEHSAAAKKGLTCPHCQGDVPFEVVSSSANESRIVIMVKPAPGELMQARTIGGTLTNMDKALTLCGKEVGVPTVVLLEGVTVDPDGSMHFKLLIARHEEATAREKRRKRISATTRGEADPC